MELRVPPDLEAKLNRLAESTGRTAEQLALDLLATLLSTTSGFGVRWKRDAPRLGRDGYLTATSSLLESRSAIAPDARPVDD
jgi:hypothetical protein